MTLPLLLIVQNIRNLSLFATPAKSKIHWFSKYPLGLLCWIAHQTTTAVTLAQDFMTRTNGFVDSDWLKASLSEFRSVSSNFLYTIDDM